MNARSFFAALALSAGVCSFSFAQITGSVKLDGKAPEMKPIDMSGVKECAAQHADPVMDETVVVNDKGMLKNVVVSIKPEEGQTLPGDAPKTDAMLDQQGCMYTPHIVAMMAGQKLVVRNSDPFMHNVHSLSEVNPAFNQAQPNKGDMPVDNLKSAEVFHVKCDVHGWMSAYIAVFDHPYFAVTGDDGKYSIKADQLPDGDYNVQFWHEKYGTQTQKVSVKDHKATADQSFKAEAAMTPTVTDVKLASMTSAGEKSCCSSPNRASLTKVAAK